MFNFRVLHFGTFANLLLIRLTQSWFHTAGAELSAFTTFWSASRSGVVPGRKIFRLPISTSAAASNASAFA